MSNVRSSSGLWMDTKVFRQPALHFTEHGFYCDKPVGTEEWFEYWQTQREYCIDGFEHEGQRITGEHYFYMNFCPIMKLVNSNGREGTKLEGFPDFWDGDYDYFWIRHIARYGIDSELYKELKLFSEVPKENLNGGYNIIVGKSRRKGYSYKSASCATRNLFTKPNKLTILGASDSKFLYPNGLFKMVKTYIDFINSNTAWSSPSDVVNKPNVGNIRLSYVEYEKGIPIEKGFKSEIISLSFGDNPGVARGKDADEVFFEESGKFGSPGLLKASLAATEDCVTAGSVKTGMITIFGTSGEMDSGSVDYADIHSNPEAYGCLPVYNRYDERFKTQRVGFFHPTNLNMEGYYDENGNSDLEGAKEFELKSRQDLIDKGATSTKMQKRLQERPLNPAEAFDNTKTSVFPLAELKNQLEKVKANDWQKKKGMPVELIEEGNSVVIKPILNGKVEPITSYHKLPDDETGCVVIYEPPIPNTPKGLYKIGYDPVRQDSGTSLAAIIVYKGTYGLNQHNDIIVAEYIGRTELADDIDYIAEKLAILYNTEIMHENEVSSVKNYFRKRKKLHLLAAQPDAVISKNIRKSKVARVYGCHMVPQLKDAAERYVKDWLLKVIDYDENNDPIRCLDRIYSQRLLEELSLYHRDGNFDLISALFMCIFQVEESSLNSISENKNKTNRVDELRNLIPKIYSK